MGFLDSDKGSKAVIDGMAVYQMMSCGDLPGAWILVGPSDDSSSSDVVYNRALCLRSAGRSEESLEASRIAFRRLTEGIPQRQFDPVGTALLTGMTAPVPMHPRMPSVNPTYAGIMARWLHCLCLYDCDETEECSRVAAPLIQMGIKPFQEKEEF